MTDRLLNSLSVMLDRLFSSLVEAVTVMGMSCCSLVPIKDTAAVNSSRRSTQRAHYYKRQLAARR